MVAFRALFSLIGGEMRMKQNMTQGNIVKTLVLFTVPLILSGMFQQIFNWVDAFIVGNVEG